MSKVTGIRLPTKYRRSGGGGRLMRSDNLRGAPHWITPELVGRIVNLAMPVGGEALPITTVPTRGIVPQLAIVETATPPDTHSRRTEESEAVVVAPHAASPLRRKPAAALEATIREVKQAAVRRPVDPAPSREPALPASPQARAHPIAIRQTPGAPRHVNYAERMNAAIAHLRARNFTVQRHNRDELIARWHISGWTGLFSNEQLVDLALHHGLEFGA